MILKNQSLAIGPKKLKSVDESGKGKSGLGTWRQVPHDVIPEHMRVSCHQGANAHPLVVSVGTPRPALGFPFGCGKDNRSGLRNHFPITHQLEPETKFLFPRGLAQECDRPWSH